MPQLFLCSIGSDTHISYYDAHASHNSCHKPPSIQELHVKIICRKNINHSKLEYFLQKGLIAKSFVEKGVISLNWTYNKNNMKIKFILKKKKLAENIK